MSLKKAFEELIGSERQKQGAFESYLGKVTALQLSENTCTVESLEDSEIVYYEVRISADLTNTNNFRLIPKLNSIVVVSQIGTSNYYISMFSAIEKFNFIAENESLKELIADLISAIKAITVTTGTGPSGVPINIADFIAIETRLDNFFE